MMSKVLNLMRKALAALVLTAPGIALAHVNISIISITPAADTTTVIPDGTGTFQSFVAPNLSYGQLAFLGTGLEGQQGGPP